VQIRARDDASLPPPLPTRTQLRQTVYRVADAATLDAIAAELGRDRPVRRLADGAVEAADDLGFALRFQRDTRVSRWPGWAPSSVNAPGSAAAARGQPAWRSPLQGPILRRARLSHVVYFVPDDRQGGPRSTAKRLGFRESPTACSGVGPFLQPAGTLEHHTLFLIQTPPFT
jgi:hypothetical protein